MNRRQMLKNSALAGFGIWVCQGSRAMPPSPNERLNVAVIGVGGRGRANLDAVAGEGANIVALCDVDEQRAGDAFDCYPRARRYHDFRIQSAWYSGRKFTSNRPFPPCTASTHCSRNASLVGSSQ